MPDENHFIKQNPVEENKLFENNYARLKYENQVQKVFREGMIAGFTNHMSIIIKNGKTHISDSGTPIHGNNWKTKVLRIFA